MHSNAGRIGQVDRSRVIPGYRQYIEVLASIRAKLAAPIRNPKSVFRCPCPSPRYPAANADIDASLIGPEPGHPRVPSTLKSIWAESTPPIPDLKPPSRDLRPSRRYPAADIRSRSRGREEKGEREGVKEGSLQGQPRCIPLSP